MPPRLSPRLREYFLHHVFSIPFVADDPEHERIDGTCMAVVQPPQGIAIP